MFKRVIWFGGGMAAGAGATIWAAHKVREQIDRAKPSHLAVVAADAARAAGTVVRDALSEGRVAARAREVELRDRFEPTNISDRARTSHR